MDFHKVAHSAHQWVQKTAVEMRKKQEVEKQARWAQVRAQLSWTARVNINILIKFEIIVVWEEVRVVRDDVVSPED